MAHDTHIYPVKEQKKLIPHFKIYRDYKYDNCDIKFIVYVRNLVISLSKLL